MASVRENVKALKAAKSEVEAHCMCARLVDDGAKFTIIYPDGDFPVDGVRVPRSAAGLALALAKMESHWTGSFPGAAR